MNDGNGNDEIFVCSLRWNFFPSLIGFRVLTTLQRLCISFLFALRQLERWFGMQTENNFACQQANAQLLMFPFSSSAQSGIFVSKHSQKETQTGGCAKKCSGFFYHLLPCILSTVPFMRQIFPPLFQRMPYSWRARWRIQMQTHARTADDDHTIEYWVCYECLLLN